MAEKAVKDLEKIQLQEKAKEKYKEWLKKKRAEDSDKKKKEKVSFFLMLTGQPSLCYAWSSPSWLNGKYILCI